MAFAPWAEPFRFPARRLAMRLPDFVVIGAAKSGTTSLYALLDRHADIFMPRQKEPEFFARDDLYALGVDAYAQAFAEAGDEQCVGEASTLYTLAPLFPETAARLAEHAPQTRLIYIMRQPVDRAYSYYVQLIKTYQNSTGDLTVHRSFEDFTDPERHKTAASRETVLAGANTHLPDTTELCLAASDYVFQVETWLQYFPREQMLFLKFEDFVADSPAAMRQITDFLDLPPLAPDVFKEDGVTRNVSTAHFHALSGRRAIDQIKNRMGHIWALRRLLPGPLRAALKTSIVRKGPSDRSHVPPKMEPATRERLTARFRSQQSRLTAITGLSFDDWWD